MNSGLASLALAIVSKYCDACPLSRLSSQIDEKHSADTGNAIARLSTDPIGSTKAMSSLLAVDVGRPSSRSASGRSSQRHDAGFFGRSGHDVQVRVLGRQRDFVKCDRGKATFILSRVSSDKQSLLGTTMEPLVPRLIRQEIRERLSRPTPSHVLPCLDEPRAPAITFTRSILTFTL
jgi:hypothetical protein